MINIRLWNPTHEKLTIFYCDILEEKLESKRWKNYRKNGEPNVLRDKGEKWNGSSEELNERNLGLNAMWN